MQHPGFTLPKTQNMDLYTHLNHICIHKMTKKQYGKFAFLPFFSAGQRLNDWSPESFLHSSLSPLPACIKPLHYSQGRLCIMTSLPHVPLPLCSCISCLPLPPQSPHSGQQLMINYMFKQINGLHVNLCTLNMLQGRIYRI